MPRPDNKTALLEYSQANFERLNLLIDSYTVEEQQAHFPEGTMNRNIRDVLMHLHHWHLMLLDWYKLGMAGQKPEMPAKGYTWKDTPLLNRKIWEDSRQIPLAAARQLLQESHQAVSHLIERHTNEELFEKKKYPWTGSTSLGAYLVSASSSHYDWAWRLIKKAKK